MRTVTAVIIALILAVGGAAVAASVVQSPLFDMPAGKADARAGACLFQPGGWTIVDCSNVAAAASSALNQYSRYVLQCGVDSYVAWGTSGSVAADALDGYLPKAAWVEFMTTDSLRFFSCLNIGTDSDCRYIECL